MTQFLDMDKLQTMGTLKKQSTEPDKGISIQEAVKNILKSGVKQYTITNSFVKKSKDVRDYTLEIYADHLDLKQESGSTGSHYHYDLATDDIELNREKMPEDFREEFFRKFHKIVGDLEGERAELFKK